MKRPETRGNGRKREETADPKREETRNARGRPETRGNTRKREEMRENGRKRRVEREETVEETREFENFATSRFYFLNSNMVHRMRSKFCLKTVEILNWAPKGGAQRLFENFEI